MAAEEYQAYLARFDQLVGPIAVGAYGKFHGKLVRKLAAEEFDAKYGELVTLAETYRKIIQRGDTLNDTLTKLLRERQTELLLDSDPTIPSL
jgi:hypothetical protein